MQPIKKMNDEEIIIQQQQQLPYINTTSVTLHQHDVFLDKQIESPENYRQLLAMLFNASEQETFNIFLNTGGGSMDSAMAIIEGIRSTNAQVTAVLVGSCHSAGSILSMYAHDVMVADSAYMMIHTASFGAHNNTSNMKAYTDFTYRQVDKLLTDAYTGFLSEEELAQVKTGTELWFDAEEIRTRFDKRAKYIESLQAAEEEGKGNDAKSNCTDSPAGVQCDSDTGRHHSGVQKPT